MKNIFGFILFISLMLTQSITFSQNLLDENFNYPAGDSLGANEWVSFSGGSTNVLRVTSPGLTYNNYPLSGIGNAVTVRNSGQDAYRNFSSDSAGSIYASFMVRDSIARTGDYFIAFLPSTSITNYTARLFVKDSSGLLSFGISKSASAGGDPVYTGAIYSSNVTYLLVLKYTFNASSTTDDQISLYIFSQPTLPLNEPETATVGPITGTSADVSNIGRIAIRQGTAASSPNLILDGIRITRTWDKIPVSIKNISFPAESFHLFQNYPNPFNPVTKIEFSIPQNGLVDLSLYNTTGKKVKDLISEHLNQGSYSFELSSDDLTSGVYFYIMRYITSKGENFMNTKKLILLK